MVGGKLPPGVTVPPGYIPVEEYNQQQEQEPATPTTPTAPTIDRGGPPTAFDLEMEQQQFEEEQAGQVQEKIDARKDAIANALARARTVPAPAEDAAEGAYEVDPEHGMFINGVYVTDARILEQFQDSSRRSVITSLDGAMDLVKMFAENPAVKYTARPTRVLTDLVGAAAEALLGDGVDGGDGGATPAPAAAATGGGLSPANQKLMDEQEAARAAAAAEEAAQNAQELEAERERERERERLADAYGTSLATEEERQAAEERQEVAERQKDPETAYEPAPYDLAAGGLVKKKNKRRNGKGLAKRK